MTKTERELLIAHRELNGLKDKGIQRIPTIYRLEYIPLAILDAIIDKEKLIDDLEAKIIEEES